MEEPDEEPVSESVEVSSGWDDNDGTLDEQDTDPNAPGSIQESEVPSPIDDEQLEKYLQEYHDLAYDLWLERGVSWPSVMEGLTLKTQIFKVDEFHEAIDVAHDVEVRETFA